MVNTKTVSSTVDDTKKLQSVLDSVGNVPTVFNFETTDIEVISPVKIYSGTVFNGNGCLFNMKENASTTVFPSMTPVIGNKQSSFSDIDIFNVQFDGNSEKQTLPLGKGYHNFIGLSNGKNVSIHGITVKDSLGDGSRLTSVENALWYGNNVLKCGHDAFYVDGGSNIEAWENYVELRTNSAVRLRHVNNGYAHDNKFVNTVGGGATSPAIQIEVSIAGRSCTGIVIENNEISQTNGPGMWIIGVKATDKSAAQGLIIRNNLFYNCGNVAAGGNLPGVGGIICDGWDNVDISYNTFNKCKGYGVGFGQYVRAVPSVTGLKANVYRNIFANTLKSYTAGTSSGAPVARLVDRYTDVTMTENCIFNNVAATYRVNETGSIYKDPMFDGESNVVEGSPCIKEGYRIGRTKPDQVNIILKCEPENLEKITTYIPLKKKNYEVI